MHSHPDADAVRKMPPIEYLDYVLRARERPFAQMFVAENINVLGLRAGSENEAHGSVRIFDAAHFREFLVARGIDAHTVDEFIHHSAYDGSAASASRIRANKENYKASLQQLAGLLVWGDDRLVSVPVGVAETPFLEAGATFVPSGGDVILLSCQMYHTHDWLLSMEVLRHRAQLPAAQQRSAIEEISKFARFISALDIECIWWDAIGYRKRLTEWLEFVTGRATSLELADLVLLMDSFTILHEFGHIALGHTNFHRTLEHWDTMSELRRVEVRAVQRVHEFEADDYAAKKLMQLGVSSGNEPPRAHTKQVLRAVVAYFCLLDLAGPCRSDLGLSNAATHPAPLARLGRIMDSISTRTLAYDLVDEELELFTALHHKGPVVLDLDPSSADAS